MNGDQPVLRLVFSRDSDMVSRCKASSFKAASPPGSAVRPCSMSLTEEGARPMRPPISDKVMPLARRSETRVAHVLMEPSLRYPVDETQRQPVTGFREYALMAQKPTHPTFSTVGERIVYWRELRGMKRPELARLAKMAYSTLAGIEDGDQKNSSKLPIIGTILRVNPYYLSTGLGDPEDMTVPPADIELESWPFPFKRSELLDLDPVELELAGFKFEQVLRDIKSKRQKHKGRRAS